MSDYNSLEPDDLRGLVSASDCRRLGLVIDHATYAVIYDGTHLHAEVVHASDDISDWPLHESFLREHFAVSNVYRSGVYAVSCAQDLAKPSKVKYRINYLGTFADYLP